MQIRTRNSHSHCFGGCERASHGLDRLAGLEDGTNNEGVEYGRTPVSNLDASYIIGSTVYNFGSADQANTDLSVDFGSFNASANF